MIDDIYSLLAWCKEEELKAQNFVSLLKCELCPVYKTCTTLLGEADVDTCYQSGRKKSFREMIDHIEKSPIELHRTLTTPREFDLL